ncbi:MAG: nucleotidyl transferase AbiEii/AbiGii toxin family protein [Actinobacteria bacterium]|nr:nucleotidyl transferase AbiEii/AbiGii toxin family protein [Actinomycetota bacterium]
MSKPLDAIAAEAFQSLRSRAKAEYGGNTQGLLVVYGTESFLRRLAISPYANRLVLKGGMLMAANGIRQMTRDGDFSARGLDNDLELVTSTVARILRLEPDPHDGIVFDADSLHTEIMREDREYHGVRCKTTGHLGKAVIPLSLDLSFGDTGGSEVITINSVVDRAGVDVMAYPLSLNLAEKVVTVMQRGAANTRDRDFADLWVAGRLHSIKAELLRDDIVAVAKNRGQPLVPLRQALDGMPDRQASYAAMLERMSYLAPPPEIWNELLQDVTSFLDPLIEDENSSLNFWSPDQKRWII